MPIGSANHVVIALHKITTRQRCLCG